MVSHPRRRCHPETVTRMLLGTTLKSGLRDVAHESAPTKETREGRRVFRLNNVRVSFGDCHVLETGVLQLDASSTVALMGPNGSGKTTLLRVLSGLLPPTSGQLETSGDVSVGYVCQHHHPHAYMPMLVSEVLAIGRYRKRGLFGRLRRSDKDVIGVAAERLNVAHLRNRAFGELSGGQRQRVMVAMVLASEADCLLLDEPITGLDLPSQAIILDVVAAERAQGRLVVMSTHHLQEARRCDRVVLVKGLVLADGTPDEVLRDVYMAAAFGGNIVSDRSAEHEFVMESHHAHGAVDHSHGPRTRAVGQAHDGHHGHHHEHDHDEHLAVGVHQHRSAEHH